MNEGFILDCVRSYKLDTKLRVLPANRDQVLGSPVVGKILREFSPGLLGLSTHQEMRQLFFAYLGAIVVHKGFTAFHNFMQSLIHRIDNTIPVPGVGGSSLPGTSISGTADKLIKSEPVEVSLPSTSSTQQPAKKNVSILQEAASKGKFVVSYESTASGQPHAPLWTLCVKSEL